MFSRMVEDLSNLNEGPLVSVSKSDYEKFKYQYCIDVLKGLRYGQAFCIYFGISSASPLFHFVDNKISERWIEDNYIIYEFRK